MERKSRDGWAGVSTAALVTGAAGFIGVHLTERLHESGWLLRGLDDERSGDWARVGAHVDRVDASLEDLDDDALENACAGIDVVFHLAAEKYNSPRATPESILKVNVAASRRLLDAAARAEVQKVVFTSSLYAYGALGPAPMRETDVPTPTTLYGLSKVAGEHLLRVVERDHGLRWTVGRLFFIYGPRQWADGGYKSVIVSNFERLLRGAAPTIYGDGGQALDYVYVDDCVDALVAMAEPEHDGRTYNIASGHGTTINDLTAVMLAAAGSTLEPVHRPPDWTQGTQRVGSPNLAAHSLKWTASTPIEEGVRRVWSWMKEVE